MDHFFSELTFDV